MLICLEVKSRLLIALGGPAAAAAEVTVWTAICWNISTGKSDKDFGGRTSQQDSACGSEATMVGGLGGEEERKKKDGLDYDCPVGIYSGRGGRRSETLEGGVAPEKW